jgi:hypothetical protein
LGPPGRLLRSNIEQRSPLSRLQRIILISSHPGKQGMMFASRQIEDH